MTSCFLLAQDSSLYLRVHSGEKLFKCDQCSYLSTRAWNLKLHKLNHTGETPYKCGQCHYPTVCGQNANERLAYCPDFYCGWHFVRPNFWLAFCLDHLNMFCQNHEKCRHLSECEWSFVRSVDFLPYRQKANLAKSQSLMTLVGHSYEAHFHNSKCSEDDIRWSERFSYVLRRFHYILIVLRLFSQKKAPKSPWVLKIWCRLFVAISKVCKDQLFYRVSKISEFSGLSICFLDSPPAKGSMSLSYQDEAGARFPKSCKWGN